MNNREQTFIQSTVLNGETVSGIRPVSIGSITLLQLLNNPFLGVVLNGDQIPLKDILSMLQFVYIHKQPLEQVTKEVIKNRLTPDDFNEKVITWGMNYDIDDLVRFATDILRDKDNISNSKTKSIKSTSGEPSKNAPSQVM